MLALRMGTVHGMYRLWERGAGSGVGGGCSIKSFRRRLGQEFEHGLFETWIADRAEVIASRELHHPRPRDPVAELGRTPAEAVAGTYTAQDRYPDFAQARYIHRGLPMKDALVYGVEGEWVEVLEVAAEKLHIASEPASCCVRDVAVLLVAAGGVGARPAGEGHAHAADDGRAHAGGVVEE